MESIRRHYEICKRAVNVDLPGTGEDFRFHRKSKSLDMQVKNGCYITPAEADASKEPWTSFDTVNDRWYGPDKHYWFRTTITVPESFRWKNLWMRVHAGLDDWDDGRNPQFLLVCKRRSDPGYGYQPPRSNLWRENAKAGENPARPAVLAPERCTVASSVSLADP